MRGKIVNLCLAFTNILFGILIVIFTKKVPQDMTLLTIQESFVVKYVLLGIYIILGIIVLIDAIQSYNHKADTTFNTGYLIGIFAVCFIFIKQPIIGAFNIVSGVIVLFKTIKENLVEIDSTTGISISIVLMVAIGIIGLLTFNYDKLGDIIKNRENKNELAYSKDYFKYITELDIQEPYINVKKNGKYGYIDTKGQTVIDFKYDYASPFVEITVYDKKFYVALMCENGSSYIKLKNERTVMSYRSESEDTNYKAKLKELERIYRDTLGQVGNLKFEIPEINNHINTAPVYQQMVNQDYDFRYDYNDEYDLLITQSNMGRKDKYELAKKSDLNIKIALDTDYLDYDASYLYLFSNGTIPFYEISKRTQGWFTPYGKKNAMTGKAQILDFFGEKILLKNYNNDTIYFINSNGDVISPSYKDIYVSNDGRYIVRDEDNYLKVIDEEYNDLFGRKYAVINPRLVTSNLYLVLDSTENIEFNEYGIANITWSLMNYDGQIILDGIEQIYDQVYELPEDKEKDDENYKEFEENLKDLKYKFVGDKFYLEY